MDAWNTWEEIRYHEQARYDAISERAAENIDYPDYDYSDVTEEELAEAEADHEARRREEEADIPF